MAIAFKMTECKLCSQVFKKIVHIYRFADQQPLLLPVSVITLLNACLHPAPADREELCEGRVTSTKTKSSDVTRCSAVTVMQTNYV
jgi:hypothetical protein